MQNNDSNTHRNSITSENNTELSNGRDRDEFVIETIIKPVKFHVQKYLIDLHGSYIGTHNIKGVRNVIVGTRLKPDLRRTERPGTETTQRTGTRTFSKKKLCRGRPSTVTIHTFAEADVGRGAGTARTSASRGSLVETCASKFPNFNL